MQELYICKIFLQPLLHPVFLHDGRSYELEAVAKNFEGKTKAQLVCPSNRAPIVYVTYAFDLKAAIDKLYENEDKQNQDKILEMSTSSITSAAKGKERIQDDESENKIPIRLEQRYQGYNIYTKDEYMNELTQFLKQNDPDRIFQMPPKLAPHIANPAAVQNDDNAFSLNGEEAPQPNVANDLPQPIEHLLPQNPMPANELDILPAGEAEHLIRRDRFFPRQVEASLFRDRLLRDSECSAKIGCCSAFLTPIVSAGLVGAIFLYRGIDSYNKNFQAMAIEATNDISKNCSYNPDMSQDNPVPLNSAYNINTTVMMISGAATFSYLAITYTSIFCIGASSKKCALACSLIMLGALTSTLLVLKEMNEKIWMATRGQIAGYNSEYTYRCYNSTADQHCLNVTPTQCNLGLNGMPASDFAPFENKLVTPFGGRTPHLSSDSFFTGYSALVTLIILNSLNIVALYAINALARRYGIDLMSNNNQDSVNDNDAQEAQPRRGYGAA